MALKFSPLRRGMSFVAAVYDRRDRRRSQSAATACFRPVRAATSIFGIALILAAVLAAPLPVAAQFRGTFGPQTTNQTAFTAEASTGPSGNFRNVGQTVHFLTYTTSGTVTQLSIQLEGSDNGTDFIRISDVATNVAAGAVYASVYKPIVRSNITILAGGGTVTAAYSGASVGLGPPTGIFLTSGTNINFLGNDLDADTTATFDVDLPTGGSGGVLYFTYSAAGFAGSTIAVDAGPDTAHLSAVLGATSLANVDTTQAFRVTPFAANVARVTFTTGGATAVTYDLAYSFGGGQATAVDILSSPATGMAVIGPDAAGSAITGDPVLIGGADNTSTIQNLSVTASGRLVLTSVNVPADNTDNLSESFFSSNSGTNFPLAIFPFLHDGSTWDMMRGSAETGILASGVDADGGATTVDPVLIGGTDGSGLTQTIMVSSTGRQVVAVAVAPADDAANLASELSRNDTTGSSPMAVFPSMFDGSGWDMMRGTAAAGVLASVAISTTTADAVNNNAGAGVRTLSGATGQLETRPTNFNGSTWDRERGNEDVILLASALRTVTTTTADQTNFNGRGIMFIVNVTAEDGTVTLSPRISFVDPVTGTGAIFWTATSVISSTGFFTYLLYPGAIGADFGGTEAVSIALPRTWSLTMTLGGTTSMTYSVGASIIR